MLWSDVLRAMLQVLEQTFELEKASGLTIYARPWSTTPTLDCIWFYPMEDEFGDWDSKRTLIHLDLFTAEANEHDLLNAYDRHATMQARIEVALKTLQGGAMDYEFKQWRFSTHFAPTYMSRLYLTAAASAACFDNNN